MNKLLKFIAVFCIMCLLASIFPFAITASSVQNDNDLLYGRKQLQKTSEVNKMTTAYDRIVEGIENRDSRILLSDLSITGDELKHIISLYKNDPHPHFWLGSGYSYSSFTDGTVYALKPSYNELGQLSDAEFQNEVALFNSEADSLIEKAGISDSMSQYEIELRLHDVLVKELDYASTTNAHNAYGAIVEKAAVCQGYTLALNYLLRLCKIEAHYVSGYSKDTPHSWSLVNVDGEYYYSDVTWDDPIGTYNSAIEIYHSYFNLSYSTLSKDHVFSEISYELPDCTDENGSYFAHNPERIMTEDPDPSLVASFFKDGIADVYVPEELFDEFIEWYGRNALSIAEAAGYDTTKSISYLYTYMGCELHLIIEGTLLISEEEVLLGDLNGDGMLSAIDANLLMRIISGSSTPTSEQIAHGDMDGDGRLTCVDSNLLKRLIIGK